MELPIDQIQTRAEGAEREIKYWVEVLQKSEKYERLMAEEDFREVVKDIGQTVDAHTEEIQRCLSGMSEASPRMLEELQNTIFIHQILREQAELAMNRPKKILELAREARKKLPELKESLRLMQAEISNG